MDWAGALKAIVGLLIKWGSAIAAYFAGRGAEAAAEQKRQQQVTNDELDAARRESAILADDAERERLRKRFADRENDE